MRNKIKNQSGQAIIESIVAISLVTVGLLGILTMLSRSIAFNRNVTNKFVATYLAAEGIEVVKNVEDANFTGGDLWNQYLDTDGDYEVSYDSTGPTIAPAAGQELLFDDSTGIYGYVAGDPSGFVRTVEITNNPPYEIMVLSRVEWSDKGEAKNVELEDHFFNWRQ
jgi:type II secretory pathway pseudopilin PulG